MQSQRDNQIGVCPETRGGSIFEIQMQLRARNTGVGAVGDVYICVHLFGLPL